MQTFESTIPKMYSFTLIRCCKYCWDKIIENAHLSIVGLKTAHIISTSFTLKIQQREEKARNGFSETVSG